MALRTNTFATTCLTQMISSPTARTFPNRRTTRTNSEAALALRFFTTACLDFSIMKERASTAAFCRTSTVPLANERAGDFSPAAAAANGVTYPTIYNPTTGQPFSNNQIPAGSIDPYAAKIMTLFPLPNQAGEFNNYIRNARLTDEAGSYNGRVDWVASSSNSMFARYTYSNRSRFIPGYYGASEMAPRRPHGAGKPERAESRPRLEPRVRADACE